jgi:hypothetical protein
VKIKPGFCRAFFCVAQLEKGLLVTVNSADQAYFGGCVNVSYVAVTGPATC